MREEDKTIIRDLIRDEQEAIVGYEKAIAQVENKELVKVLEDIRDEEIVHIGELEELLRKLGVNDTTLLNQGAEEAIEKLEEAIKKLHSIFKEV